MRCKKHLLRELNKWLRAQGCEGNFIVRESASRGGLGLFVESKASVGEPVLLVPSKLSMKVEEDGEKELSKKAKELWLDMPPRQNDSQSLDIAVGLLSLKLLEEASLKTQSVYGPYIDALPTLEEISTCAWMWEEEVCEKLLPETVATAAVTLGNRVKAEHAALEFSNLNNGFSLEEYQWAQGLQ